MRLASSTRFSSRPSDAPLGFAGFLFVCFYIVLGIVITTVGAHRVGAMPSGADDALWISISIFGLISDLLAIIGVLLCLVSLFREKAKLFAILGLIFAVALVLFIALVFVPTLPHA